MSLGQHVPILNNGAIDEARSEPDDRPGYIVTTQNPKVMFRVAPEVYEELKTRAKREGRAAMNLAAHLLTGAVLGPQLEPPKVPSFIIGCNQCGERTEAPMAVGRIHPTCGGTFVPLVSDKELP